MKYINAKGQRLSRFSLGTVQLGMKYGLGEDCEKPSEEAAFALLDRAMELGVDNLDTANNYGDSEAVIGRWLRQRKVSAIFFFTVLPVPAKHPSPARLRKNSDAFPMKSPRVTRTAKI